MYAVSHQTDKRHQHKSDTDTKLQSCSKKSTIRQSPQTHADSTQQWVNATGHQGLAAARTKATIFDHTCCAILQVAQVFVGCTQQVLSHSPKSEHTPSLGVAKPSLIHWLNLCKDAAHCRTCLQSFGNDQHMHMSSSSSAPLEESATTACK